MNIVFYAANEVIKHVQFFREAAATIALEKSQLTYHIWFTSVTGF